MIPLAIIFIVWFNIVRFKYYKIQCSVFSKHHFFSWHIPHKPALFCYESAGPGLNASRLDSGKSDAQSLTQNESLVAGVDVMFEVGTVQWFLFSKCWNFWLWIWIWLPFRPRDHLFMLLLHCCRCFIFPRPTARFDVGDICEVIGAVPGSSNTTTRPSW